MAKDIYQEIWDEDQQHCGLKAIKKDVKIDKSLEKHGYVVVDEKKTSDEGHKVIVDVHIPAGKQKSYDLVEDLFNNYVLDQTKPELNTPSELKTEQQEIQSFIEYAYVTPPMQKAREFYVAQSGKDVTDDEWWAIIERVWFDQFDIGANLDLSGFEHVVVGEQQRGKVQGYHFWYKYYLDERFVPDTLPSSSPPSDSPKDAIHFLGWEGTFNSASPDCVTLSFIWEAFDYKKKDYRKLTKPIGGFWVGPSVEGLLAIGTVRFLEQAFAPKQATINGITYNLELFRSPDNKHLRTFFPKEK